MADQLLHATITFSQEQMAALREIDEKTGIDGRVAIMTLLGIESRDGLPPIAHILVRFEHDQYPPLRASDAIDTAFNGDWTHLCDGNPMTGHRILMRIHIDEEMIRDPRKFLFATAKTYRRELYRRHFLVRHMAPTGYRLNM